MALPPVQCLSSHRFPPSSTEICPGPCHPHQPEPYFLKQLLVSLSVLNTDPGFYDNCSSLPSVKSVTFSRVLQFLPSKAILHSLFLTSFIFYEPVRSTPSWRRDMTYPFSPAYSGPSALIVSCLSLPRRLPITLEDQVQILPLLRSLPQHLQAKHPPHWFSL